MTGIIKVDDIKDAGGNSIISSNGSGTLTYTFNAGSIAGAAIANDAIDSAHYADGSIDLAHMSVNSIDSDQYVDGSIDLAHMSVNSIDSDQYVDGSIDTAHIADNQVTLAKMAGLARGKIIYGNASGDPTALALGSNGQVLKSDGSDIAWAADAGFDVTSITGATALAAQPNPDDDEFVISDNGTLKRLDYKWLTNRNYFFAYLDGAHTVANSTTTKLEMDAVKDFGDGSSTAGLDTTNKRLVPTYPGYYFFAAGCRLQHNGAGNNLEIKLQKNGNEIGASSSYHASYNTTTVTSMDYMNGSSDYIELFLNQNTGDTRTVSHYSQYTYLLGFRLSGH